MNQTIESTERPTAATAATAATTAATAAATAATTTVTAARVAPPGPRDVALGVALGVGLGVAGVLAAITGCRRQTDASLPNFTAAVDAYLARRGDLCVARAAWPVVVTQADVQARTRDAVQMPVLERLNVVASSTATDGSKVTRYRLTERGLASFIDRDTRAPASPDRRPLKNADLCLAHLTLDKIAGWEIHRPDPATPAPTRALVSYTYRVDAPAWTGDPEARHVFPAVDRVLGGARVAQLKQELTLTAEGWIATELLPAEAPAARPGGTAAAGARVAETNTGLP